MASIIGIARTGIGSRVATLFQLIRRNLPTGQSHKASSSAADLDQLIATPSSERLQQAGEVIINDIRLSAEQGFIPEALAHALLHNRAQQFAQKSTALAAARDHYAAQKTALEDHLFALLEEPLPTKPVIVFRNVNKG